MFFPAAPAGSLMVVTVTQKTLGIEGEDLDLERQQLLDKVGQVDTHVAFSPNDGVCNTCKILYYSDS